MGDKLGPKMPSSSAPDDDDSLLLFGSALFCSALLTTDLVDIEKPTAEARLDSANARSSAEYSVRQQLLYSSRRALFFFSLLLDSLSLFSAVVGGFYSLRSPHTERGLKRYSHGQNRNGREKERNSSRCCCYCTNKHTFACRCQLR